MTRRLSLFAVALGFLAVPAVRAQFGIGGATEVTQLLNHAELISQVQQLVENYRNMQSRLAIMEHNLEKMDVRTWRELSEFMDRVQERSAYGKAVSYAAEGGADRFLEFFPANFTMNTDLLERGETVDKFQRVWYEIERDTYAGAFAAAEEHGADVEAFSETIAELQASADAADGLSENLHVMNMVGVVQAQEVAKLNQLLATSINVDTVHDATDVAVESLFYATLEEMLYPPGWDSHSLDYEDYTVLDPVP